MAGTSNLAIAVQVLAAMPGNRLVEIDNMEQLANAWLSELEKLAESQSDLSPPTLDLRAFLRELQRQGNLVQHRKCFVY
jgi:hypothetical protein